MLLLSPTVTAKISVGCCLDTGKGFVFEVSFQSQERKSMDPSKKQY